MLMLAVLSHSSVVNSRVTSIIRIYFQLLSLPFLLVKSSTIKHSRSEWLQLVSEGLNSQWSGLQCGATNRIPLWLNCLNIVGSTHVRSVPKWGPLRVLNWVISRRCLLDRFLSHRLKVPWICNQNCPVMESGTTKPTNVFSPICRIAFFDIEISAIATRTPKPIWFLSKWNFSGCLPSQPWSWLPSSGTWS